MQPILQASQAQVRRLAVRVAILFQSFGVSVGAKTFYMWNMPVRVDITPPPPANSKQPGVTKSLLYNGSKFQGFQKSKGNSYEVEVVLQVSFLKAAFDAFALNLTSKCFLQCQK